MFPSCPAARDTQDAFASVVEISCWKFFEKFFCNPTRTCPFRPHPRAEKTCIWRVGKYELLSPTGGGEKTTNAIIKEPISHSETPSSTSDNLLGHKATWLLGYLVRGCLSLDRGLLGSRRAARYSLRLRKSPSAIFAFAIEILVWNLLSVVKHNRCFLRGAFGVGARPCLEPDCYTSRAM